MVAPAAERQRLRAAREAIAALDVAIHQPSEAIGVAAARLRGAHPISLPDAYCLATGRAVEAEVSSFDGKVVRAAEREGIGVTASAVRRPRRR